MASFVTLHGLHSSLLRSQFLGQDHHHHLTHHFPLKHPSTPHHNKPSFELHAKFNILEIMGGRGICKGEVGLEQELKKQVDDHDHQPAAASGKDQESLSGTTESTTTNGSVAVEVPEDGFEKEMMGLTGGFPGGEKGLIKFIEENPPPKQGNVLVTLK